MNDEFDADAFVEELKAVFKADSDSALADVLQIHRSTISSWRKRGRVPKRYRSLRDYTGPVPDRTKRSLPSEAADAIHDHLLRDEHIRAAMKVALFRFLRECRDVPYATAAVLQTVSRGAREVPMALYSIWSEIELRSRPFGVSPDEAAILMILEAMDEELSASKDGSA